MEKKKSNQHHHPKKGDKIKVEPIRGIEDIKSISLGGVPISVGRVGFKYYLIVNTVMRPCTVDLTANTIAQYKMNDDTGTTIESFIYGPT